MADTPHAAEHHGPSLRVYLIVAVILGVCTSVSFSVNSLERAAVLTAVSAFLLILSVSCLKAALVGLYFMHLKWDWRYLYFLLIPVFIMGAMMAMVLMPDIFLGPYHDAQEAIQINAELTSK
jgi:cytochrome c oxidase subunit IV